MLRSLVGSRLVPSLLACTLSLAADARAQHYTFSILAGVPDSIGSDDGRGDAARFNHPQGVVLDEHGTIYIADTGNHTIRKMTPTGSVVTIAGSAGQAGSADGVGSAARFNQPHGIGVDRAGTVWVADTGNHTVRAIAPDGTVTTVVGLAGVTGSSDGAGSSARFDTPWGLAIDDRGTVYVSDRGNQTIRTVTYPGVASTLAGQAGSWGTVDGTGPAARFSAPLGLTAGHDVIFVAESMGSIRQVTRDGVVTTKANLRQSGVYCIPNCFACPGTSCCGIGCHIPWMCGLDGGSIGFDTSGLVYAVGSGSSGFCASLRMVTAAGAPRTPLDVPSLVLAVAAAHRARDIIVTDASTVRVGAWDPDGDQDGLPDEWELMYGLSISSAVDDEGANGDPDQDGTTNHAEFLGGTHPRGAFTRLFAEGATLAPFDTRFALLAQGYTRTCVRFEDREGRHWTRALEFSGRTTVWPSAMADPSLAEFSTTIESDALVVADRTMTWSDGGIPYGAHAEHGVSAPAPTWYLAEGATHSGLDLFYLLLNPSDVATRVEVTYLRPAPLATVVKQYDIGPRSRFNIWVNQADPALAATDVSAVVTSMTGTPIVVERAMYMSRPGRPFEAGHESAGVTAPSTHWFLAEGATGPFFDMFVLLANPGTTDAQVDLTFLRPDGSEVNQAHVVRASSRVTVWVDHADPRLADTAVATVVTSTNDVPIVVERALWWPEGGWYEAHNSPGALEAGTEWALAEGEVDASSHMETYVLIANTSATPASIAVELTFEDGTFASRHFDGVAGRSRFNVPIGETFPEAAGRRFGVRVASLEGQGRPAAQIVVERAMYWDAHGQPWAAGTNALATRLR